MRIPLIGLTLTALLASCATTPSPPGTPPVSGPPPVSAPSTLLKVEGRVQAWTWGAATLDGYAYNPSTRAEERVSRGTIAEDGAFTLTLPGRAEIGPYLDPVSTEFQSGTGRTCTTFPAVSDSAARTTTLSDLRVNGYGTDIGTISAAVPSPQGSVQDYLYYYADRALSVTGGNACTYTLSSGPVPVNTTYTLKLSQGWNLVEYRGRVANTQPPSIVQTITTVAAPALTWRADIDAAALERARQNQVVNVTVTPSPLAAYPQQTVKVSAVAKNAAGTVVTGRSVTWTTSDAAVATVDATGRITALAPGSATIRASLDGQSGQATLQVLPLPVADWSAAAEWTTHNGNATHTGFVNATLNPTLFREAWASSPLPGTVLNGVSVGGGSVFVTSNSYFSNQKLVALDLLSGQTRWSHDFGSINSVHPPAYANGRVFVTTGGHQDAFLYAFAAGSGTLAYRSPFSMQWEHYLAPTIVDGTVYMGGGYYGGMYAFGEADGKEKWFTPLNQYDGWTPAVRGGVAYAHTGSYSPELTAIDTATGTKLYGIPDPGFDWSGWTMNSAPVIGDRDNVLSTASGRLVSFDLQRRAVGWELKGGYTGTVAVAGGAVYAARGTQLEVRDEQSGALSWMWVAPDGDTVRSVIVTRNLLLVSTGQATYALDLGARAAVWSHPAGGLLSLSGQGTLLIAQSTGKVTAIGMN